MSESLTSGSKSEILSETYLSELASKFSLTDFRFVRRPDSGIITENAILEDTSGKRFFAKFYERDDFSVHAGVYRAAELVAADQRLTISLPIPTIDGSYTASIAGRAVALFDYIEHSERAPENDTEETALIKSMAFNLGLIHAVPVPEDEALLSPINRWQPEAIEQRQKNL